MDSDKRQMQENINRLKMFILKALHFLFSIGLFYGTWLYFRYNDDLFKNDIGYRYNYYIVIAFGLLVQFFNRTYNAYLFGYLRIRTLVLAQFLAQSFSMIIIYLGVSLAWQHFYRPSVFVFLLGVLFFWDCLFSYVGNWYYFKLNRQKRTLLIYRNNRDRHRFGTITGKPMERLYYIDNEIRFDGTFDEIKDELKTYDAVFVAGVNSHCRNGILKYCEENNISGLFLPHVGDVIMQGAQHVKAIDSPVLMARRKVIRPDYRIIKRGADIVLSIIGMIITSPLFGIISLLIKIYDQGPVFYKQTRLTKDGKQFKMIKFRSMRTDAEKDGMARLSTGENDERITPIGKIIRLSRFDELPQLWNVLKGDMSLVGPRPERPEIAELYYEKIPDFKLRLQVKAGLTGYAQVYGKYNTDPYEKLEFDILYINQMSILTDIELLFATVGVLFKKESTKGVKGTTAIDYDDE